MVKNKDSETCDGSHCESPMYRRAGVKFTLREMIGLVTIIALVAALWNSSRRLRDQERELTVMRKEFGYLAPSEPYELAASRSPSDQPLSYRMRVRLPPQKGTDFPYQIVYSSLWEAGESEPTWFGGVRGPGGESLITVQILDDPRDGKWKLATVVSSSSGTSRMSTVLPPPHEGIFRGSYDVISAGIGRDTLISEFGSSVRLLDERWLIEDAGVVLDGFAPKESQVGVYAELRPLEVHESATGNHPLLLD